MNVTRLKALLVLVLMVASFAGAAAWRPRVALADLRPRVDLEVVFPRQFGPWTLDTRGPALLVSPDAQALLNKLYSQTLSRTYVNEKGERIMLSVAYGGDQSDASKAHRPEVCYPAQGFQLLANSTDSLSIGTSSLRVRRLVAKMGGRVEPISYWMMVGERATVTGTEQKLAQLSYGTQGVRPDGMLIRVSSIGQDAPTAYRLQDLFVQDMLRAVQRDMLPRVAGSLAE